MYNIYFVYFYQVTKLIIKTALLPKSKFKRIQLFFSRIKYINLKK